MSKSITYLGKKTIKLRDGMERKKLPTRYSIFCLIDAADETNFGRFQTTLEY